MQSHEIQISMFTKFIILFLSASLAAVVAEIVGGIAEFILIEGGFFFLLFVTISIDTVFGATMHLQQNNFSFKEMTVKMLKKLLICYLGFLLFLNIAAIEGVAGTTMGDWFVLMGRISVILYPAGSAFENSYIITNGKFPPIGIMKRLKKFNETLSWNGKDKI